MLAVLFIIACIICLKLFPVSPKDFTPLERESVTITGQIMGKEWKNTADSVTLMVTLKDVLIEEWEGLQPEGKVFCYLTGYASEPEIGSVVRIAGKFACFERATNPGQFSQADYYRILKVDFKVYQANILAKSSTYDHYEESLCRIKNRFGQTLDRCFDEKEATIMRTMLLGENGQTDREIKELYKRNGIIHILSISGLHISMIGMSLYRLLRRMAVPIPLASPVAVAVMYSYGAMTGMGPSSLRAIVMFCMHMTAYLLGRTYDLLTALAVSAILILLEQPLYFYHSGFLFSFLAVLAIGLFIPAMNHSMTFKTPWLKKSVQAFLSGFGISAFTLPVYVAFYYQFPLYSVLLNLLVIPLTGILMAAGIIAMTVGSLCLPLGKITSVISSVVLWIYEKACILCDQLPYSNLITGQSQMWQIIVYGIILVFLILFHKKIAPYLRYLILSGGILILVLRVPTGLTMTFLDVGQGDCIYIQTPSGQHYLIDGGSSSSQSVGEYRILPFLKSQGVRRLDGLFITHPDKDHCSAFPELIAGRDQGGISIARLILPAINAEGNNEEYRNLERMAEEAGITVQYIGRGQSIKEGDLYLQCLHPEIDSVWTDSNAYSTVLLLKYHAFSALLTGDIEGMGEQALIRYISEKKMISNLTVLKVPHHGSRNSTEEKFLQQINPAYAVISAGYRNSYGHPHKELMERLDTVNAKTYITYESGAVTIKSNGKKMKVERFLQE